MSERTKTRTTADALASIVRMTPEERAELEARFRPKTERRPDPWCPETDPADWCREWTAAVSGKGCGYGYFHTAGTMVGAHRVAFILAHGPIPAGHDVRHLCHNPRCVRPDHLASGTRARNARDAVEAGRTARMEGDRGRKLTAEDDAAIAGLTALGESTGRLVDAFGVTPGTIRDARARHARRVAVDAA